MINPNDIEVSFCIPTFNRAEFVKRCIESILEIECRNIEIVVVNNDSSDDTEKTIKLIDNPRISYYKNEKNIGVVLNIIKTIELAKGKWVFLLSDEDIVLKDNFTTIIDDISKGYYSETSVILGNIRRPDGSYYLKYTDDSFLTGDEALYKFGFSHAYMSGILINKRHIPHIKLIDMNIENVDFYPHICIIAYTCLYGNIITINRDWVLLAEPRAEKSYIEKPCGNIYPHPHHRIKQFKIFAKIANEIVENSQNKVKILSKLYIDFLYASTYGWEDVLNEDDARKHFGLNIETSFNFWSTFREFDTEANKYFNEILIEPEMRRALDEKIFQNKMLFMLNKVLNPVKKPLFGALKRVKKTFH